MPTDPNPEVIESVKSALRLVSDYETGGAVMRRAIETAKANGVGYWEALATLKEAFGVQPFAVSGPIAVWGQDGPKADGGVGIGEAQAAVSEADTKTAQAVESATAEPSN